MFCSIVDYISAAQKCLQQTMEIWNNRTKRWREKSHSHETEVHAILYFNHARKANSWPSHLEASSYIQITRKQHLITAQCTAFQANRHERMQVKAALTTYIHKLLTPYNKKEQQNLRKGKKKYHPRILFSINIWEHCKFN